MQEGWHYELSEPDGELTYNGVVYNEMKGEFSSPESLLDRYTRLPCSRTPAMDLSPAAIPRPS